MTKIFISHSSANNGAAIAVADWLEKEGWGRDDIFLDLDPAAGIAPGERWVTALHRAVDRCQAVIFLISRPWLKSDWCKKELEEANRLNKSLFGIIIENEIALTDIPSKLTHFYQLVNLADGKDGEQWTAESPDRQHVYHGSFSVSGLVRLKRGLQDAGLDPSSFKWPPDDEQDRVPYRGFRSLEAKDAGIFFGRNAEIVRGIDEMRGMHATRQSGFMPIVGASGSGKSSFMRAGLMARLRRDDRRFLVLPPIRPAFGPLTGRLSLLSALESILPLPPLGIQIDRSVLRSKVVGDRSLLEELLLEVAVKSTPLDIDGKTFPAPPAIVITIDQAEELFPGEDDRLTRSLRNEIEAFLDLLSFLCRPDDEGTRLQFIVLMSIRADAVDALLSHEKLLPVPKKAFALGAVNPANFTDILKGPALLLTKAGKKLELEDGFCALLLEDIMQHGGPDKLPLLAFVMERMYRDYGGDGIITAAEYRESGRISGALDAVIQVVIDRLDAVDDRKGALDMIRKVLVPNLVRVDPVTYEPVSFPCADKDFPDDLKATVDAMVNCRILTRLKDAENHSIVQIAHEALIRQWKPLTRWMKEGRERIADIVRANNEAADWEANGRKDGWLKLSSTLLKRTKGRANLPEMTSLVDSSTKSYLEACENRVIYLQEEKIRRKMEKKRQKRNLRLVIYSFISTLIIGIIAISYISVKGADLNKNLNIQIALTEKNRQNAELQTVQAQEARSRADELNKILVSQIDKAEKSAEKALVQETIALSSLSEIAAKAGASRDALKLAVAAWPRSGDDARPQLKRTWDSMNRAMAMRQEVLRLDLDGETASNAYFMDNDKKIVTVSNKVNPGANSDETEIVRVWNAADGHLIGAPIEIQDTLNNIYHSKENGLLLAVIGDENDTIDIYDMRTQIKIINSVNVGAAVMDAAFSPDGKKYALLLATEDEKTKLHIGSLEIENFMQFEMERNGTNIDYPLQDRILVQVNEYSIENNDSHHAIESWNISDLVGKMDMSIKIEENSAFSLSSNLEMFAIQQSKTLYIYKTIDLTLHKKIEIRNDSSSIKFNNIDSNILTENILENSANNIDKIKYTLVNLEGGKIIYEEKDYESQIFGITMNPSHSALALIESDASVQLMNIETGLHVGSALDFDKQPQSIAFSSDGNRFIATGDVGFVRIWPIHGELPELEIPVTSENGALSVYAHSPTALQAIRPTSDDDNSDAVVLDIKSGKELHRFADAEHLSFVYTGDGQGLLVSNSKGNQITVYNSSTWQPVSGPHDIGCDISDLVIDAAGSRIAVNCDESALLFDPVKGKPIGDPIKASLGPGTIALSPDGRLLAVADDQGKIRIHDASNGKLAFQDIEFNKARKESNSISDLKFSPNGKQVFWIADGQPYVLMAAIDAPVKNIDRAGNHIALGVFSKEGSKILLADDSGRSWLSNVSDGLRISPVFGFAESEDGSIQSSPIAFSAKESLIVSFSDENSLGAQLRDSKSGLPVRLEFASRDIPTDAFFFDDDRRIALIYETGLIEIWAVPQVEQFGVKNACEILGIQTGIEEVEKTYGLIGLKPICSEYMPVELDYSKLQ